MTREEAHKLVDLLYDAEIVEVDDKTTSDNPLVVGNGDVPPEPARDLPKDKRVVRTKTSGDRVYLLDEVKKTRQWITNPDVLDSFGFELGDVGEVDEDEMLKFQMGPALYRRVDE